MKTKVLCLLGGFSLLVNAALGQQQSPDHAALAAKILELRASLGPAEAAFLSPSAQDCLDHPAYADTPGLGLIRLLPREKYENIDALTTPGSGAYYSFFRLSHEYGFGSDIELTNGDFKVGFAGADYGFFAALGEQKLEDVNGDLPDVRSLAEYKVPARRAIRRNGQRSDEGTSIDAKTYADHIKAVVNQTYLLRSVNCDRSDVLVAFRVVREDGDGSLILAWKMLQKASLEPPRRSPSGRHPSRPLTPPKNNRGLIMAKLDLL